jgi:hypothetical protein
MKVLVFTSLAVERCPLADSRTDCMCGDLHGILVTFVVRDRPRGVVGVWRVDQECARRAYAADIGSSTEDVLSEGTEGRDGDDAPRASLSDALTVSYPLTPFLLRRPQSPGGLNAYVPSQYQRFVSGLYVTTTLASKPRNCPVPPENVTTPENVANESVTWPNALFPGPV